MAAEEVPLLGAVRQALDSGHPLDLLGLASMLILATTSGPVILPPESEEKPAGIGELVASLIDVEVPETTALLTVLGEMLGEGDALGARCRNAAAARRDAVPGWLAALGRTSVHRAVRMTHVLGDGDELLLGVRFADGQEMTCVVNIDHLAGSSVGDAFFVPDSVAAVLSVAEAANTDPDTTFDDITVADARAGLHEALERPLSGLESAESDTWPACRALVQWLGRLMPPGGSSFLVTQWSPEQARDVCTRFLRSPAGAPFRDLEHRVLLLHCLQDGDPLRWSAARLSRLLESAVAEDAVPSEARLDLPEMMAAFVPFAHAEAGISDELTAESVAAVVEAAEDYRTAIRP
ncbi:hypothetical protein AU195_11620 [Mycobacterium sp. IS-1496]|uniref:hypothetical protein n=1 Tax=Mycobacterium sp. IS-1496 TaxID=1772284 RepID=UPI0007415053|nr:hypothetical protein [Mycobacterium sp. IS-1496]KUI31075.1 hypothetical protein AU195_11620 [Mycobacterium sp. IS-1496]